MSSAGAAVELLPATAYYRDVISSGRWFIAALLTEGEDDLSPQWNRPQWESKETPSRADLTVSALGSAFTFKVTLSKDYMKSFDFINSYVSINFDSAWPAVIRILEDFIDSWAARLQDPDEIRSFGFAFQRFDGDPPGFFAWFHRISTDRVPLSESQVATLTQIRTRLQELWTVLESKCESINEVLNNGTEFPTVGTLRWINSHEEAQRTSLEELMIPWSGIAYIQAKYRYYQRGCKAETRGSVKELGLTTSWRQGLAELRSEFIEGACDLKHALVAIGPAVDVLDENWVDQEHGPSFRRIGLPDDVRWRQPPGAMTPRPVIHQVDYWVDNQAVREIHTFYGHNGTEFERFTKLAGCVFNLLLNVGQSEFRQLAQHIIASSLTPNLQRRYPISAPGSEELDPREWWIHIVHRIAATRHVGSPLHSAAAVDNGSLRSVQFAHGRLPSLPPEQRENAMDFYFSIPDADAFTCSAEAIKLIMSWVPEDTPAADGSGSSSGPAGGVGTTMRQDAVSEPRGDDPIPIEYRTPPMTKVQAAKYLELPGATPRALRGQLNRAIKDGKYKTVKHNKQLHYFDMRCFTPEMQRRIRPGR
jgi:hypothetical protein